MNIEAYNLDSLRKLVRDLQKENKQLRGLLEKAEIPYEKSEVFSDIPVNAAEYDPDQGARINQFYIDRRLATQFFAMFWEEKMYLRSGQEMEIITLSVIIVGKMQCVQSKRVKRYIARIVSIKAGQS